MPAHRSAPRPLHLPAARPAAGRRRAGGHAHAARIAGHLRHSHAGRAVVAAMSAVAVVSATAVVVAAAVADPAVADGHRSVVLTRVQDVVTGSATPGVTAASAVAQSVPTHADLAVNAASVDVSTPVAPKQLTVKQRYGIDVSWPQCGTTLPTISLDFAVIGLTDGHAESVSPCFSDQVAWAKANHLRVAVYVVPNSPGTAASATVDMEAGRTAAAPTTCTAVDAGCPAYADGVRQAQHALAAASVAKLPRAGWWLDVEESATGTLWGDDTVANSALLKGWVDTLRAAHLPVGAYSTHGYWTMITGGWDAGLPQWVPVGTDGITDAQQACAQPFTSGPVVMTQWLTGPYDGNMLCPTTDGDPMARAFTRTTWATKVTAGVPALLTTPVPHPELEQAQAEADAASDCPTDPGADPQPKKKQRAADPKKDPKDTSSCGDDSTPKTKSKGDGKTPKTKGQAKPKTKAHTQHHGKPRAKPKGKHHRG